MNSNNRRGKSESGRSVRKNGSSVRSSANSANKKKNKKSVFGGILKALFVVAAAVAIIVLLFTVFYKPGVDEKPGFDTGSDARHVDPSGTEAGDHGDGPAVGPGEYKRKDSFYNFLVMGKDHVAENTDVIILASFDTKNGEISLLQVPRDTYIEYDGYAHKINYLYGSLHSRAAKRGDADPVKSAMEEFSDIIEKNMCVKIDYYAIVDLEGFSKIVDAMGGVKMDIPYDLDYDDPEQDLHIHLRAGNGQILNGDKAEQFVRFRKGFVTGDVGRVDAQKIFISAFLRQLKSSFSVSTVSKLAETVFGYLMSTNISVMDGAYFAKEMLGVDLAKTVMVTLPGADARAEVDSGAWYYILSRADTLEVINRYMNVYTVDITESLFDRDKVFTSSLEHIDAIYEAEAGKYSAKVYTADGVNETPPDIPLMK